jgi:hypothetical protein
MFWCCTVHYDKQVPYRRTTENADRLYGPRDHPISHLPTYICENIQRAALVTLNVTHRTSCGMSLKRLRWQSTSCLMFFSRPGILDAQGSVITLAVMVDCFDTFIKPLITGQMPFCLQEIISSLSTTSSPGMVKNFHFFIMSRLALGFTQPPM